MADRIHLDRTYTYGGAHYGPGVITKSKLAEDEKEHVFDAIEKKHAAILRAEKEEQRLRAGEQPDVDEDGAELFDMTSREAILNPMHEPKDVPPAGADLTENTGETESDAEAAAGAQNDTDAASAEETRGDTAEQKELYKMTNKALAKLAVEKGIDISGVTGKDELVKAIAP